MFNKILVALDNSENSQKIFEKALSLAKVTCAKLMLLNVFSDQAEGSLNTSAIGLQYYPSITAEILELQQQQQKAYQNENLERLRSYTDRAIALGVNTEFSQNSGNPGRTICEIANTWAADLIVIGRRGYSGLNELLLGSVSNYVLHHAFCSVLIVQGQTQSDSEVSQDNQFAMTT